MIAKETATEQQLKNLKSQLDLRQNMTILNFSHLKKLSYFFFTFETTSVDWKRSSSSFVTLE